MIRTLHLGRLVITQHYFLVTVSNFSRTRYDNPVFAAVVVHLQAEPVTGLYFNSLDLIACPSSKIVKDPKAGFTRFGGNNWR